MDIYIYVCMYVCRYVCAGEIYVERRMFKSGGFKYPGDAAKKNSHGDSEGSNNSRSAQGFIFTPSVNC